MKICSWKSFLRLVFKTLSNQKVKIWTSNSRHCSKGFGKFLNILPKQNGEEEGSIGLGITSPKDVLKNIEDKKCY